MKRSKATQYVDMVKHPIDPSGSGSWGCWWEIFRLSIPSRCVSVFVVLFVEDRLFVLIVPLCILVPISPRVFFFLSFVVLVFSDGEGVRENYGKETSFLTMSMATGCPWGTDHTIVKTRSNDRRDKTKAKKTSIAAII